MLIGAVIALTLLSTCTTVATVGGAMPLVGSVVGVDPAVFSNPLITTFVDASSVLVYLFITRGCARLRRERQVTPRRKVALGADDTAAPIAHTRTTSASGNGRGSRGRSAAAASDARVSSPRL